jgi:D-3-phosphoglycerate dehydrogenase
VDAALPQSVVFTDVPWGNIDLERSILEPAGISAWLRSSLSAAEWTAKLSGSDGILTCWDVVDRAMMRESSALRVVARIGVGLDNIDLVAAEDLGLVVTNVPDYCVHEVAEYVLAATASWARGLMRYSAGSRSSSTSPGEHRLADLTIGIWGLGLIGSMTASLFASIGCRVLGYSSHLVNRPGVELVQIDELLARSDVVSLHVPGRPANDHLLDDHRIGQMKKGALLVNAARGSLVDGEAVLRGLRSGRLGAAILDVIDGAPDVLGQLHAQENCLITPHIAFSSAHSEHDLRERVCADVIRVLHGEVPHHQVVPRV